MEKIQEKKALSVSGFVMLVALVILGYAVYRLLETGANSILSIAGIVICVLIVRGLTIVQPNEAKVLVFFG